jgi:Ala-tRNA(Pro) deacylase
MSAAKLKAYLDENKAEYTVIRHETSYTSQATAQSTHISGKEIAKTVIVNVDNKSLAMVVLPAPDIIDFDRLRQVIGAQHVLLAAELEFDDIFPDCEVGAMPPFGNLYCMQVYIERSLCHDREIAFNAGNHQELIRMQLDEYLRLVNPKIIDIEVFSPKAGPRGLLAKTKLYGLFLQESGKMMRQLIEDSHSGVYIADDQGRLVYVNPALVRIMGHLRKDDVLGKNLAAELYTDPGERGRFIKEMEKTGFVADYEIRNLRKDRPAAVLSVTGNWIKDEEGRVMGQEGIVHDITEKKKMEEAFREEKEKLNQIINFEESLSLIHDIERLGKFAVEQITEIFQAQKCSLMLYNQEVRDLYIQASQGLSQESIANTHQKLGEQISGVIAQRRQPVLVSNIEYDKDFHRPVRSNYSTRSFMSAPVLFGPKFLGVINVADKASKEAFKQADLKMLCVIARAVAITVENAGMFRHLENLAFKQPWVNLYRWY